MNSSRNNSEGVLMVFPLFVHYVTAHLEGAVVWVQQEFGQRRYLRGAIPAIWAVHQHGSVVAGPRRSQRGETPWAGATDAAATLCSPEQTASYRHNKTHHYTTYIWSMFQWIWLYYIRWFAAKTILRILFIIMYVIFFSKDALKAIKQMLFFWTFYSWKNPENNK